MTVTTPTDRAPWRAGWQQFRRRRRALIATEALGLAAVAVAMPMAVVPSMAAALYPHPAGYDWTPHAGEQLRELAPNIDRVLSWGLWIAMVGAAFAAAVTIGLVTARLISQLRTPPQQWRRVAATARWAVATGALWAASSVITTRLIVDGLVMA